MDKEDGNGAAEVTTGRNRVSAVTTPDRATGRLSSAAKGLKVKKEYISLSVPKLNLKTVNLAIVGDTPVIFNQFSGKMRGQIEDRESQDKASMKGQNKEPRNPQEEFEMASYRDSKGRYCAQARQIKASMVKAVKFLPGNEKGHVCGEEKACGMFQILGEDLPLIAPPPRKRDDVGKNPSTKKARLIYRPEHWPWAVEFTIMYNADLINEDGLMNLLMFAGFHCGLAEWRPQKKGNKGMFHPARDGEVEKVRKETAKLSKRK